MQKILSFLAAAMFVLSGAVTARADVDAGGAEVLKKHVVDAFAIYTEMSKSSGSGLTFGGDITVAPKDAFYEVTLPDMTFVFSADAKFKAGTVVANAVPGSVADEYILSVKLPPSFTAVDKAGRKLAEISMGRQNFSGVWRPLLGAFTKLEAEYGDIGIKLAQEVEQKKGDAPAKQQGDVAGMISSMKASINLSENSDKTWSGSKTFKAEGLGIKITGIDNGAITIAGISSDATYDKMDLAVAVDIARKALEMVKDGKTPTAAEQKNFFEGATKNLSSLGDSTSTTVEVNGVKVDIIPGKDPELPTKSLDPMRFSVNKIRSAFDVKGMSQERGRTRLKLGIDGVKAEGQDEDIAGLVPSQINVSIGMDNLPMKEMIGLFSQLITQAMDSAIRTEGAAGTVYQEKEIVDARMKTLMIMSALPQLLINAGSSMTISDTNVQAADLSCALDGKFMASPSALPVTGAMTLSFNGLDETIKKLQELSKKPDANPRTAGTAQMLIFLQMQGQLGKGADGRSTRSFKFEATPDGKMLLNGIDMSVMMGMMGGAMGHGMQEKPGPAPVVPQQDTLPREEKSPTP